MKKQLHLIFCLLAIVFYVAPVNADSYVTKDIYIVLGESVTVDPYKDSGLSSECVISTDASLWEVGEANALTVSVKSETSTSYGGVSGTRTIFTVTANKWGTYELSGWAQGWSTSVGQITCWLTYNVTVVDNGGGVYKDYDVCHYSNGVHYHFDRNDDAANTLTLKHVINGANENHMHGYPALYESMAVTAVSIPSTFTSGSVSYTVTRIDGMFASSAVSSSYNDALNKITKVTVPSTIKSVSDRAFIMGMGGLKTVVWNSTYCVCTGPIFPTTVTSITFGSTARRVPAFITANTSVTSLTVPETMTQVGSHAFSGTKLKTLVFNPTKCSIINLKAFAQYTGTPGTNGFAVKDNTTLTTLTWNCPEFTFSSGNPLSYDNGSTLDYVKGLETLIIGDAITDVDGRLFNNLPMKTVTLPEGLKTIAPGAFGNCSNLATVNLNSTYVACTGPFLPASVTKMTFGSTARRVPAYATAGTSIASLTVPATMTQVGSYAFSGSMLKTLVFNPTKCSIINLKAFAQYTGTHGTDSFTTTNNTTLTTLTWNCPEFTFSYGNPLTYDNGNVLDYVKGIDKLIVGDAIINVPDQLFSNLPMKSVEFSSNVKTIGLRSFENCSELREMLVLPSSLTAIGARAFAGCSALRGPLVIPVTVSSIGASAFEGCSGVSSIHTRPVKTLGNNAFLGTSGYCFIGKTTYGLKGAGLNPTVIYITATTPPECDASTFAAGCDKTSVPVNVPQASAGAYSSATEWKDFTGINGINMVTPAWDIPETFTLTVGQSEILPCVPASATDFVPAFYSTDDSIVQIDGTGRMTAMQAGEVDIVVTECLTRHICHVTVGSGSTGVAGDLDGSGLVDVDDVNELINYILGKSSNAGLASIADIDGSGLVDVDDVNAIINIILSK